MYSLKCNINLEVNHLSEGITLALKDDREKNSEALGRPAMYIGESRITKCGPRQCTLTEAQALTDTEPQTQQGARLC